MLAIDVIEVCQKPFDRVPRTEIIKQGLYRNTRAEKAWRTAETLRIHPDDSKQRMTLADQVTCKISRLDFSMKSRWKCLSSGHDTIVSHRRLSEMKPRPRRLRRDEQCLGGL